MKISKKLLTVTLAAAASLALEGCGPTTILYGPPEDPESLISIPETDVQDVYGPPEDFGYLPPEVEITPDIDEPYEDIQGDPEVVCLYGPPESFEDGEADPAYETFKDLED